MGPGFGLKACRNDGMSPSWNDEMIEIFSGVTLVKAATAILMVVLLSMLTEVVGPRAAGILSGYPLGAAISLFFIGLEISPQFAAESALYTSVGLIATQAFVYAYYRGSLAFRNSRPWIERVLAPLTGVAGYFLAAILLRPIPASVSTAILLPVPAIFLFTWFFRDVVDLKIQKRADLSSGVLLLRAVFAAAAVILITSTAKYVGPEWAGLFSAFPITLLPLAVIIHWTYGPDHVYTILKNVPRGIGSLVVYSLAVFLCYPRYGVYFGTLMAYGLATLYLLVIYRIKSGPVPVSRSAG